MDTRIFVYDRWADRAKSIKNKPKINEDPKDALLREFQEEIARLKAHLDSKGGGGKKKKRRRTKRGPDGMFVAFVTFCRSKLSRFLVHN